MVRIDMHIDSDSLIGHNRERLRLRAHMPADASLHIESIMTRWQRYAIISVPIRSNPRYFFLSVLTQDDQWIVGIVSRRLCSHVVIGGLDRLGRDDR